MEQAFEMSHEEPFDRLDPEWVTLNAVRELMHLATEGNPTKSTYQKALEIGDRFVLKSSANPVCCKRLS